MMTRSRDFGGAASWLRAAVQVMVVVLVATVIMFGALGAGLVAVAGHARAEVRSIEFPVTRPVKYYIVPTSRKGHALSLSEIAARTLGAAGRYTEIFRLNKGRLQPNGNRLESPRLIEPGWILQLPSDATGPGVHFGPLPRVTPSPVPSVSHRSARPTQSAQPVAGGPAPRHSSSGWVVPGSVIAVVLLVIANSGVVLRRGRRAGATAWRTTATVRPRHRAGGQPDYDPGPRDAGHLYAGPRDPGNQGDRGWPPDSGGFDWSDWGPAPQLHPDHPSAPVPKIRVPDGGWDSPPPWSGSAPDGPPRWPAPARTPAPMVPAPAPRPEPAVSYGRHRAVLTQDQAASWVELSGLGVQPAQPGDPLWPAAMALRDSEAIWLAGRILSTADERAVEITHQASGQAMAMRLTAEREAAEIRQQASAQAAAILEAAEREAAELRATLTTPVTQPAVRPRQYSAMRLVAAAMIGMLVIALSAGSTELALHGYSFFVFRAAGTGVTPGNGLQEDQGPGQPDAPGAHPQIRPPRHNPGVRQSSGSSGGGHG